MKSIVSIHITLLALFLSACEQPKDAIAPQQVDVTLPFDHGTIDLYENWIKSGDTMDRIVEYANDSEICWLSLAGKNCEPFGGGMISEYVGHTYKITKNDVIKVYYDSVQEVDLVEDSQYTLYRYYYRDGEIVHKEPQYKSIGYQVSINDVSGNRIIDSMCLEYANCAIHGDQTFWKDIIGDARFSEGAKMEERIIYSATPALSPRTSPYPPGTIVVIPDPTEPPVTTLPTIDSLCADLVTECTVDLNNGTITRVDYQTGDRITAGVATIDVMENNDFTAYRFTGSELAGGVYVMESVEDQYGYINDYQFVFADEWKEKGRKHLNLNPLVVNDVINLLEPYIASLR